MSPGDTDIQYYWVDGAETLENYVPGGYHPVMVDDVLHGRYRVVHKLGFGGYSTVWLARDMRLGRYVTVKVGIASESKSLLREIQSLQALSSPQGSLSAKMHVGRNSVPHILDQFEVHGSNGTHVCYTMTPSRCNLQEVSFNELFSLEVTRALVGGLVRAVSFVHSQGYVHGDIHLHNILLKLPSSLDHLSTEQLYETYGKPETAVIKRRDGKPLPPNVPVKATIPLYLGKEAEDFTLADTRVLLTDFGEAYSPASEVRRGEDCHTPPGYRPPEALFEPQSALAYSADIWSLATAIWEIIGMKAIFSTDWVTDDELVSQYIDILGPMPPSWWDSWEARSEFFDRDRRPVEDREVAPPLDQAFEQWVQKYRRKRKVGEFPQEEAAAIINLIRRMLVFRPEERPSIDEVLKSEWMVKWVWPDYEKSLRT
ncbi:CMGC/SRPK protein kinase [Nannizzia gypsea CBS 118893]|uniref:non-specific serine/threonine protein kinase n=1 Tax=Arthroderma gypseum (strain ATCC MYA-4604 / CBS 118893) TaxID=535722 RepID=E4USQ8_ARTGP|nr:CMGC/SRPK protein kinase [Nannizzia gypsea CBS 118893]EFR00573.1 CMGC/SRPK protein kinase [Nannizzia gypsea CBS 118893]